MSSPKVLIIGAGIAGLSAADRLINHGINDVTILEATDRIGGRIHTLRYDNGLLEMGANWIHGKRNNPIFELAKNKQLLLRDTESFDRRGKAFSTQGKPVDPSLLAMVEKQYMKSSKEAENIFEASSQGGSRVQQRPQPSACSVGEFVIQEFKKMIEEENFSADEKKLSEGILDCQLKLECCISGCHSMGDVALVPYGQYQELGGGDAMFLEGFESVIKALRDNLPDGMVQTNKAVRRVLWKTTQTDARPVTIECKNGDTYAVDHAIVTCSLGYLKNHAKEFFQPALPDDKLHAIGALGFGTVGKIYLQYSEDWGIEECSGGKLIWDDKLDVLSGDNGKSKWYHKLYAFRLEPRLPNVLIGWVSGYEAEEMERLSNEEVGSTCTAILRRFFNKPDIPEPHRVIKTSWNSNPYTRGAYSYVAVDSSGEDVDVLAKPLPYEEDNCEQKLQILFAGEATHSSFYSTTHGALLSGQREADRIISMYRA